MSIHGYVGNIITANPTAPTVTSASGVWTTEQQLAAVSAGNWPGYEYPVTQSLRFNSADSAYLNRTPASATNRQTWTWSAWFKRCNPGTRGFLFSAGTNSGTDIDGIEFNTDSLRAFSYNGSFVFDVGTNAVFRDPSAWYHIVVALDTTQATNTNRIKIYVNNVQQTFASATYPSQNANSDNINNTVAHYLGTGVLSNYGNGYLTEVNFVDGQALTPSDFGLNDPETGVWSPKRYTGTYGTNGFYLNFSDNSGTTSTTLGKDSSGNGNNWTPNNFSVTAGSGNDSMVDTPTPYGTDTGVGGEVRGNYCTWNPLVKFSFSPSYAGTYSNGNLDIATGGNSTQFAGTMGLFDGCYWEVTAVSIDASRSYIGLAATQSNLFSSSSAFAYTGTYAVLYSNDGTVYVNTTSGSTSYGSFATWTNNDVISVAFKDGKIYFAKNGTWINSGVPASGTGFVASGWNAYGTLLPYAGYNSNYTSNFGQRAFAYTAPSGFKALCTTNLPTPTIGATSTTQANDYMNVVLYSGNSSTQNITGVGFAPDFTWLKVRNDAQNHRLFDTVRGANKRLMSSSTAAEATTTDELTAFGSDGFTLGANTDVNGTGFTYVSWNWNAGGSTVTNTSGTISAQVRANTTSGFSIISYTGNKTSGATIGHGLGVAPAMVIFKERANASEWIIYHQSLGATQSIYFSTAAANTNSIWFNNTAPSSTVITLGNADGTNRANTMIAYAFAPVANYSAFGSYTGNGSTDGPFVYLGFRPEFVMIKNATTAGTSWEMFDNARETSNLMDLELLANSSNAEGTYTYGDFVSNGFKLRSTNNGVNQSTATLIYMAFAENPFKYALAR